MYITMLNTLACYLPLSFIFNHIAVFIFTTSLTHNKKCPQALRSVWHHAYSNFPVHCLPLLLGDENKVSLLGLGALEPLCQLITHNNKLIRRNAFMALGIMATNGVSDNIQNQCRLTF